MELVENVDFYWDEDKMVLSSVYLRKQKSCCNSKCRHCPYENWGTPDPEHIKIPPSLKVKK